MATMTPVNQRDAQKLATRRALSAAAIELFTTKGYDETRVEDIAAEAGVTARTFFHHFASKDAAAFPDHTERVAALEAALAAARADGSAAADPVGVVADQVLIGIRQTTDSRIRAKRYRLLRNIEPLRQRDLLGDLDYERVIAEHLLELGPARGESATEHAFRARSVAGGAMAIARAALSTWSDDPSFDAVAAASARLRELG